jgi:hypothetical protein
MPFRSVIFATAEGRATGETPETPVFFANLNLDQIVDGITAGREEYDLKPFFYASVGNLDGIKYRHQIFQDLQTEAVRAPVVSFAKKMRGMREHLTKSGKLYYKYQKKSWFLDAVEIYCDAVDGLFEELAPAEPQSRGLLAFGDCLRSYRQSDHFVSLRAETKRLKDDLATIRYSLQIKGDSFTVRKYASETDYSSDVLETFAKFKQGAGKDYRVEFRDPPEMNHIEAAALDLVAKLYPEIFVALDQYCERNVGYLDTTIGDFDREVQFYLAYLEYAAPLERAGLSFCYPDVRDESKDIYGRSVFDLALARKLTLENAAVVCNDFDLSGKERVFVVSGPNQGGKTTFARTFGQLHYLASLGCPVPGREARLFLFDRLFTHFEKQEDVTNLRGKLEDDLLRIHDILDHATSRSVVIMNEIFTSTTLTDAVFLGRKVMERIIALDLLCVCVTFIDELASMGEQTVSVVSTVVPENPAVRTYKILRRPADGRAYAISIAEKYRLTRDTIRERIRS